MTVYYDKMINELRAEHAARIHALEDEVRVMRLRIGALMGALRTHGIDPEPAGRVQCVRCGKFVEPSTTVAGSSGSICAAGCDKS